MTTPSEFTERSVAAVADLGLFFVGASDQAIKESLLELQSTLEAQLAEPFGPEIARDMAREFVSAVAGRRREIEEVASAMPRALN
jgi:hypothetical protein